VRSTTEQNSDGTCHAEVVGRELQMGQWVPRAEKGACPTHPQSSRRRVGLKWWVVRATVQTGRLRGFLGHVTVSTETKNPGKTKMAGWPP
jgi:hypothetical protein